MLKKVIAMLLVSIMVLSGTVMSFAEKKASETNIKLNDITVSVPYNKDEIKIVREENFQEVKVTILDAKTNEEIKTVGEMKLGTKTNYNKTVYEQYNNLGCKSRLYADFLIYSSGSFAEILDVTNTRWKEASSGGWTLEDTYSGYTKMSPNRFEIYGDATIEVSHSSTIGRDLGFEIFEAANFTMSGSVSSTWYARRIIEGGFVYSI